VVEQFEKLKKDHNWGTSLPYMVSGSQSLPQKQVMEWIAKNTYSIDSIVTALKKQAGTSQDQEMPVFAARHKSTKCLIVGGGPSPVNHSEALLKYLKSNQDVCVIHASSKNASIFINEIPNKQYFCLVGNEGYRMTEVFSHHLKGFENTCILPPRPREMGAFIPDEVKNKTFELSSISFIDKYHDSPLILALQLALDLDATHISLIGYDGYKNNVTNREMELTAQNEEALKAVGSLGVKLFSLVKTTYQNVQETSLYSKI
jgi:4-hydroxy 2-oxovalerate aldolase